MLSSCVGDIELLIAVTIYYFKHRTFRSEDLHCPSSVIANEGPRRTETSCVYSNIVTAMYEKLNISNTKDGGLVHSCLC